MKINNLGLCVTVATVTVAPAFAQNTGSETAPNILMIVSDQLSWQALGVYGDKSGSTPTIDSLAKSGVAFERTYTSCPLSMPARAALWTGQYPHTTGVESNGRNWKQENVSNELPTMGSTFTQNGYSCIHFGKQHDMGALKGFDVVALEADTIPDEYPEYPLSMDSYRDVNTTRKAVEYLSGLGKSDKPFFCVVDLNSPHDICSYIGHYQGEHENPDFPAVLPELPANFEDPNPEERPHPVQYMCCSHVRMQHASKWTAENYRHYLAAYYYYANRLDKNVARVLEALAKDGKDENTIIVFVSDHGEGMAAKRMVTKQGTPYDQTTRVPLFFAGKGIDQAKVVGRPLVNSSLDIFPTLCDLVNIDAPETLPGRSVKDWIYGAPKSDDLDYICVEWTTEWGFTVSPFRMIRSDKYKYVKYLEGGAEELYNMDSDPLEVVNLAKDNKYQKILKEHRAYLAEHIEKTNDNFYSRKVYWDPRVCDHEIGYTHHEGEAAPNLKR